MDRIWIVSMQWPGGRKDYMGAFLYEDRARAFISQTVDSSAGVMLESVQIDPTVVKVKIANG